MSVIKKHKAAFFNFLGVELMGIALLLVGVDSIDEQLRSAITGLLFFVGVAIVIITTVALIISRICKKDEKTHESYNYIRELCINYMNKTKFCSIYWIIIILMLPIWPVVLVYLLDIFTAGAIFVTAGISMFMLAIKNDVFEKCFYVVKNGKEYFNIASGEDSQLIDSLYGDIVHMYRAEDRDEENFICSLLKREGILGKSIKAYKVSNAFLSEKYNYNYNSYFKEMILVPFSQFDINDKNGKKLLSHFNSLSIAKFTNFIDGRYGRKNSVEPEDYMYTDKDIILRPYAAKITNMVRTGEDICIALDTACECENEEKLYKNCLMVLRNVKLKGSEDSNAEYIEKMNNDVISSFKCDYNEQRIELEILREVDVEEADLDDEDCEELITISLSGSYEEIEWYWDGVCDTSKTKEIFRKING